MAIGISMAQGAGRESQRFQARWLKIEWSWILNLWQTSGGVPPSSTKPPLQSDTSRFEISKESANGRSPVHLCTDGKARAGCIDRKTGRTELDLTIFDVTSSWIVTT